MSTETTLARPQLAQATLLLASMLTIMAGATIAPALPGIQRAFSAAPNASVLVGLVLTIHGLFIAVGSPVVGMLADRYGRRPLLLAATLVYAIAGGSGFVLDSLVAILAGRAVLGLAVAGVMVTVTALITDYYDEGRRDTILGRQAAFMSFGGVVLLPLAGVLADIGWRVPFLVYTVGVLLLPPMAFALPEPTTHRSGDSPRGKDDLRRTVARLPLGTFTLVFALALLSQILFYTVPVQVPFYLETRTGASATLVGSALATSTFAGGIVSLCYGRIRRYGSVIELVVLSFVLMSVGFVIVGASGTVPRILVGLVFVGGGVGFILPNLNTWIGSITPDAVRGRALGGLTSALFLGQFLSPIVVRPVIDRVGPSATFLGIGVVLLVGAGLFALTAVYAPPLTGTESGSEHSATEDALD